MIHLNHHFHHRLHHQHHWKCEQPPLEPSWRAPLTTTSFPVFCSGPTSTTCTGDVDHRHRCRPLFEIISPPSFSLPLISPPLIFAWNLASSSPLENLNVVWNPSVVGTDRFILHLMKLADVCFTRWNLNLWWWLYRYVEEMHINQLKRGTICRCHFPVDLIFNDDVNRSNDDVGCPRLGSLLIRWLSWSSVREIESNGWFRW